MKKSLYILLLLAILFSACQQEDQSCNHGKIDTCDVVYASIEDNANTKTYLEDDKVIWGWDDEILVFIGKNLRKKYVVSSESVGSTEGSFVKDADYDYISSSYPISHNVAFYPFAELTCKEEGQRYVIENVEIPSVQPYYHESFGPGVFPMMAVSADTEDVDFRFRNICGVLKLQLTGCMPVQSITITGNSGEVLAGLATVISSYDDVPELTMAADGYTSVTLECYGVQLDEDTPVSFLISLPPTVFTNGFTVTVNDTWGGSNVFVTSNKNEITRSGILKMPVKECVREPQEGDYIDEYGKSYGPGVRMGETVWASVNCGYHKKDFKYGKLYQWGRKYGQGYNGVLNDMNSEYLGHYSDTSVPEIYQGPVTLLEGQSPDNADVFYAAAPEFNNDWVYQQNGRLWNAGTEDNPVKTEYDPCPAGWRVPTYSEYRELLGFYNAWYGENEFNGYQFIDLSYISSNIELLAAGNLERGDGQSYNRGSHGCYWTSAGDDHYSYNLYFLQNYCALCYDYFGRADGYSVRCVKDDRELISVKSITLDKTTLTLEAGCTEYVYATILPLEANNWFAHWWSENPQIASVDKDGNITGVSEGATIIYAMAGMQVATCEVTVKADSQEGDYIDEYGINHGKGVKIGETVWAPVNCGYHAADFKYGKLYQWGRKYGQGYSTSYDASAPEIVEGPISAVNGQKDIYSNTFFASSENPYDWTSPQDDNLWNSGTEANPVKTEYDPCPEGWRVPTYAELDELSESYSSWTTNENGQPGYWFSGASSYTATVPQVFFPAAGYRDYSDGDAYSRGSYGYYWSSRPFDTYAGSLYFYGSDVDVRNYRCALGCSVRCVQVTD